LERYLAGECAPAEAAAIRRWVDASPENREVLATVRAVWDAVAQDAPRFDSGVAWQKLRARIDAGEPVGTIPRDRPTGHVGRWWPHVARAAAVLVIGVSGVLLWHSASGRLVHRAPVGDDARTYVAMRGQRAQVDLADGTRVVLGPDSRLRVPTAYASGVRNVYLEGEGYFIVHHDPSHPFTTYAGTAVARDIGTEFTVRAYPSETRTQVVVAAGEVAVGAAGDRRASVAVSRLHAGELARVSAAGVDVTRGIDVEHYTSWTRGELAFDNTPLSEVAADLGRSYDLDIRIADSALAARRVTITFPTPDTSRVFGSLALALHATSERHGRTITIAPAP
jgi:transmembrane sensor